MPVNLSDRKTLIAQLAWQEAVGIDEVQLDDRADDQALSISDLIAADTVPAGGPACAWLPQAALSAMAPATPEPAPASAPPSAPLSAPAVGVAVPPDLAAISSLDDLRAALTNYDDCALKNTASNMIFADATRRPMVIGEVRAVTRTGSACRWSGLPVSCSTGCWPRLGSAVQTSM